MFGVINLGISVEKSEAFICMLKFIFENLSVFE